PAVPTRRCRWHGCGQAASSPNCAPTTCGLPPTRRQRYCARRLALTCPVRQRGRWRAAPEGGGGARRRAGCSFGGQADVAGFVAAFSGSHRFVLDYLAEEVLERQSDQLRGFLLETSLLERLSGELCDAVTDRADSQAMLEQVERANLFLVPLDEVR